MTSGTYIESDMFAIPIDWILHVDNSNTCTRCWKDEANLVNVAANGRITLMRVWFLKINRIFTYLREHVVGVVVAVSVAAAPIQNKCHMSGNISKVWMIIYWFDNWNTWHIQMTNWTPAMRKKTRNKISNIGDWFVPLWHYRTLE